MWASLPSCGGLLKPASSKFSDSRWGQRGRTAMTPSLRDLSSSFLNHFPLRLRFSVLAPQSIHLPLRLSCGYPELSYLVYH